MKKLFTLMFALVAVIAVNAKQVVFDFTKPADLGITPPAAGAGTDLKDPVQVDDVVLTATSGSTATRIWNSNGNFDLRVYKNGTLKFTANDDITAIEFAGTAISFSEFSGKAWTGKAKEVTVTATATSKITSATLTIGEEAVVWTPDTISVSEAVALIKDKDTKDHFVYGVVMGEPFITYASFNGHASFWLADLENANDTIELYDGYGKDNAKWASLDEAKNTIQKGDTVLVYAGSLVEYTNAKTGITINEISGGYYAEMLGKNPDAPQPGDDTPPLPEGVISCDDAVKAAANIADPQEEKATVEGGAVVVRGYVTYAYNESKGKQSAWLSDTKGSKSGVIEGSYLTVVEAVAVGDYVELAGTLAKYKKAASGDKPAEIIIEVINGSMVKIGPDGKPIEPAKPDTISVAKALEIGQALADKAVSEKEYVIKGYSCSITDAYSEQYKNETFWISDEKGVRTDDKTKAFYVYRGKPSTQKEIGLDALVQFKCKIKNYGGIIENDNGVEVEVLEEGVVEALDTISVAKALEIGYDLLDNAVTEKKYVINGYVSSIETYFDSQYKNETFWIADSLGSRAASNKEGAFYVYRGKPDTQKEIGLNAHVYVTVLITKFSKECKEPVIENSKSADVTVAVQGLEETIDSITVAQAMAIGQGMEQGQATDNRYAITGYVSSIDVPFSAQFGNETFWITDTEGEKTCDKTKAFYVYRGKPNSENEIGLGAKISITCKIKNFKGTIENDGMGIQFEVLNEGTPLEIDTITVTEALSIGMAMEDGAYSEDLYIVKGFATKAYAPDTCKTSQNVYMADDPEERGAFYAYNCSPDSLVKDGDYILVQGKLQKYVGSKGVTIEISNGSAVHGEAPELPAIPEITVAQALEMAKALTPEEGKSITIDEKYAIKGYVIEVEDEDEYTYLLSDDPQAESGEFRAFKCASIDAPVAEGELVIVTGRIETMNIQSFYSYYVNAGVLKHYAPEGVEQVVLTEKAQKIMIDGAIYIIRNGKMFDVRGAQVR